MIKVNLTKLLEDREVSMYRLAKDTEIAYTTLWKLNTGRAQRIGFDVLEKICLRLECSPGELLTVHPGEAPKFTVRKKGGSR
ncbi:MAG: helix-turn-helix transcriptional regulator [Acidobacteriota bacterium]|nr:MAG: helix-turn-helix transcriptional regulator [Acidobacteriota bacterium]